LQKTLGFRYLMDVIPLHPSRVSGSHGRLPSSPEHGPVLIGSNRTRAPDHPPGMREVFELILAHVCPRRSKEVL
jgi:hypothetical protein